MSGEPVWFAQAKRLRDQGWTYIAIAREVGRSESCVRQTLSRGSGAPRKPGPARTHAVLYAETHVPRQIRAVLPPHDVKMAALARFASGKIDRAELSRVLHASDRRVP